MDVVDTVSRKLFAMSRSKVRLRDIEQWSCDKDVSPRIEDGRIYGVWGGRKEDIELCHPDTILILLRISSEFLKSDVCK